MLHPPVESKPNSCQRGGVLADSYTLKLPDRPSWRRFDSQATLWQFYVSRIEARQSNASKRRLEDRTQDLEMTPFGKVMLHVLGKITVPGTGRSTVSTSLGHAGHADLAW